jgi:hypothetical protein
MSRSAAKVRQRKTVAGRLAKVAAPPQRVARPGGMSVCLGVLVGWNDQGPLVEFEGGPRGGARARLASPGAGSVARREATGQEVVLLVSPTSTDPPILLGFLQPLSPAGAAPEIDARVDGRRVDLEGRDEITLRCGEASITLRRNGRVVIRGVQVETRATGLNRIKGGSVAIN